jgi:hypothetical protein
MQNLKILGREPVRTRKIKMTLPERYPDGRLKPGFSGNPSGRPKIIASVREIAREHAPAAFARLAELVQSKSEAIALAATRELLDRAYGKPVVAIDQEIKRFNVGEELMKALRLQPGDDAKIIEGGAVEGDGPPDW